MKYIDDLNNETEILNEIIEQNKNFSIEEFYLQNKNAAVGIITPIQTIYACCKEHIKGTKVIYKQIYDNYNEFYGEDNKNTLWQKEAIKMGNICIQLCSSSITLVWVPEQINMYQFIQLYDFNKNINAINKYYNGDNFVVITSDGVPLNESMNELSKRINDNIKINEKELILEDKLINSESIEENKVHK